MIRLIQRRDYVRRHVYNIWPHLTIFKVLNLMLNIYEKSRRISAPRSMPPFIKVEPTPLCQLRCPGCGQSIKRYKMQLTENMQMSLDDFRHIVDPLSKGLLGISLSNHGEPLLHKSITELIAYAHNKNIAVSVPTNLSLRLDDSTIEKIVRSGLDSLVVALDGASEETYSKYRVGGNYSLVLDNVKRISDAKDMWTLRRPRLVWKFVIFEHNKHEMDIVRNGYKGKGFDAYELVPDRKSKTSIQLRRAHKAKLRLSGNACYWLWHTMIIGWDGEVYPCCTYRHFNIGNAINDNVMDVWRSGAYKALRQQFATDNNRNGMNDNCKVCRGYVR